MQVATALRYRCAASPGCLWDGISVEADLVTKEAPLNKLAPPKTAVRRFKPDDALLTFLASL